MKKKFRTKNGRHKKPETIYSLDEANNRIADAFFHHGFSEYPFDKIKELSQFYRLLMQQQKSENFTRLLKIRDIAIKHYIDCLIVPQLYDIQFPLIDMGTGPGFPGIPLKIHFPEKKIILVEGVKKRVDFLKLVRSEMNLKNLDIIGRYLTSDFTYKTKSVITRAVKDISVTLGHTSHCLEPGGEAIFMKGPNCDEEIDRANIKWEGQFELLKNIPYELPQTPHQRRLVVYRKL